MPTGITSHQAVLLGKMFNSKKSINPPEKV